MSDYFWLATCSAAAFLVGLLIGFVSAAESARSVADRVIEDWKRAKKNCEHCGREIK